MVDVQDGVSLASRKRTYVTLIDHQESQMQPENDIVIGYRVKAAAVKRSDLLSGIEHAEGLASLPAQVTPEDIQLWQTACAVDFRLPLDELVTVLKV